MSKPSEHPEILIENCWFQEEVRLTSLADGPSLVFSRCVFEKGLDAREAEIGQSLSFIECVLMAPRPNEESQEIVLNLENAHIKGDLLLWKCSLMGSFHTPGLWAKNVRLIGCSMANSLLSMSEPVTVGKIGDKKWAEPQREWNQPPPLTPAIYLDGANLEGNLEIRAVSMSDDAIASSIFGSILGRNIIVGGDLHLYGMLCKKDINFGRARISGQINSHLLRTLEGSLSFYDATVEGDVQLFQAEINGTVTLYRATIGGNVGLLGLVTTDDLDLVFATIRSFVAAYHLASSPLANSRCLSVGRDLVLSGANIKVIELRGAEIKGKIKIITGTFGRIIMALGVGPILNKSAERDDERFELKPCRARAVEISAIKVEENLDVSGLLVSLPEDEREQRRLWMEQEGGILLTKSSVGGDLKFNMDDLRMKLESRWRDTIPQTVHWQDTPGPWACASETWGDLILRANKIGGDLDLRNVSVMGDLDLSDTSVGLDIRIDAGDPDFERFETGCRNVNAEKLECDGDVRLSGLHVRGNFRARGAQVKGELLFLPRSRRERRKGVRARGDGDRQQQQSAGLKPLPSYAFIEGELDLTGVVTNHLLLSGENLASGRRVPFDERRKPEARVNLERGDIGRLEIVKPPLLGPVNLSGTSVHRWVFDSPDEHGEAEQEASAEDYIEVLTPLKPFDRSTWIDVENFLRNAARESEADKVYVEMRKMVRQMARKEHPVAAKRWLWHLWDRSQSWGIGYGTKVWRPMLLGLLLFLIPSFIIFRQQQYVRASPGLLQILGANSERKLLQQTSDSPKGLALELSPGDLGMDWSWRDALVLTLRYHVPIIPGMTHNWWEAGGRELPIGITVEQYAFGVEVYNWVAWSLFLIGAAAQVFRGKRS